MRQRSASGGAAIRAGVLLHALPESQVHRAGAGSGVPRGTHWKPNPEVNNVPRGTKASAAQSGTAPIQTKPRKMPILTLEIARVFHRTPVFVLTY